MASYVLLAVLVSSGSVHADGSPAWSALHHVHKYPQVAPAQADYTPASLTCPVRCKWDGGEVMTEHLIKHGKMLEWVPRQEAGSHYNKVGTCFLDKTLIFRPMSHRSSINASTARQPTTASASVRSGTKVDVILSLARTHAVSRRRNTSALGRTLLAPSV